MRRTKIIATVGPSCAQLEQLKELSEAGVNIFRLNFSHGDHAWHGDMIKKIKKLNKTTDKNHAILLDTKGPEIRSADLKSPIMLEDGQSLVLTIDRNLEEGSDKIEVNYDGFIGDVEVGEKILVDGGVMSLQVQSKTEKDVVCKVLEGGELGSRRHLNLPGRDVSLESITAKDWADIKFGVEMGVDFIALSFVRKADEVLELKDFLAAQNSHIEVIAKIESFEATHHLGTITHAADGIMVARGDLGAEVPFDQVPRLQREMINTCAEYRKPVIVATHMLESMTENPVPTRAEVTDVSQATWQRSDGVMLSGETAGGQFPLKSVQTMVQVIEATEEDFMETRKPRQLLMESDRDGFARLAAQMAEEMETVDAIVVITRSGLMARLASSFRPKLPIFAFTNDTSARRRMQLLWGVEPLKVDFSSTPEKTIERSEQVLLKHYPDWKGKRYILLSDFLVEEVFVPTLQIRSL